MYNELKTTYRKARNNAIIDGLALSWFVFIFAISGNGWCFLIALWGIYTFVKTYLAYYVVKCELNLWVGFMQRMFGLLLEIYLHDHPDAMSMVSGD